MTTRYFSIEVDALFFKDTTYFPCVESEVSETAYTNNVTCLNGSFVSDKALQPADNTATHDHHDKEVTALAGFVAQSTHGKGKDTRPQS